MHGRNGSYDGNWEATASEIEFERQEKLREQQEKEEESGIC